MSVPIDERFKRVMPAGIAARAEVLAGAIHDHDLEYTRQHDHDRDTCPQPTQNTRHSPAAWDHDHEASKPIKKEIVTFKQAEKLPEYHLALEVWDVNRVLLQEQHEKYGFDFVQDCIRSTAARKGLKKPYAYLLTCIRNNAIKKGIYQP